MSEDVECPRCRGQMIANGPFPFDEPYPLFTAMCVDCDWIGPICQDVKVAFDMCRPMAYFEPRPRLPTKEEEAAHRARHGDGAGFRVRRRVKGGPDVGWSSWMALSGPAPCHGWMVEAEHYRDATPNDWESVPETADGRPVAWPAL